MSQVPIFDDFSYHDTAEVEPKPKIIHGSGQSWSKVQYLDAGVTFLPEGCWVKNIWHNTQDGKKVYFTIF